MHLIGPATSLAGPRCLSSSSWQSLPPATHPTAQPSPGIICSSPHCSCGSFDSIYDKCTCIRTNNVFLLSEPFLGCFQRQIKGNHTNPHTAIWESHSETRENEGSLDQASSVSRDHERRKLELESPTYLDIEGGLGLPPSAK